MMLAVLFSLGIGLGCLLAYGVLGAVILWLLKGWFNG